MKAIFTLLARVWDDLGVRLGVLLLSEGGFAAVGTTAGVAGNLNEAMKVDFQDPLFNNIVMDSELLDLFEKDAAPVREDTNGGRYIETAQYFRYAAGSGWRALEGDYIPVPDGPQVKNSQVYLKKQELTTEMEGDAYRRIKDDRTGWLNWAKEALTSLAERGKNDADAALLGFGAGIKCRVNAADPDATATMGVDTSMGVSGMGQAVLQFMEGERVVFGPNANATSLRNSNAAGGSDESRQVIAVDHDASTITFDSAVSTAVADDDFIFGGDVSGHSGQKSGVDRAAMGLFGMVDDGTVLATFQALSRATYARWKAIVINANTKGFIGFTEDLLTYGTAQAHTRSAAKPMTVLCSEKATRSYWADLKADRVLNDPKSYTGGKDRCYIRIGTKLAELRAIRKMPDEAAFQIDPSTFRRWASSDFEWDDTTGSIWNRSTDSGGRRDRFYATGHAVYQVGNIAPYKNIRYEGITY